MRPPPATIAESPIVLRAGGSEATIHPEIGGRLGQLDLGDGPLLRGWSDDLGWAGWGSYPLLPWTNRIPGGHLVLGSIDAYLTSNWPDGSAIHGLAASSPWTAVASSADSTHLVIEATGGPYRVRGEQRYALSPGRLELMLTVGNIGDRPVPVGLGIHPWFRAGPVRVPADEAWPGEPLPTGPSRPVEPAEDLRQGVVPPPMDRCYTALTSNAVDVPGVRLSWEGPITQVVVYSAERGWVAVEPVTMANDGLALAARGVLGHGVQLLEPAERLSVRYRFEGPAAAGW